MKSVFDRTCALRRKPKSLFLSERLLVSSRLHFNSFWLILIGNIHLQDFAFSVQAAFRVFSQTVNVLIIHTASKRISQVNAVYHCGKDDQMALPSVAFLNPLPCFHLCGLFLLLALKANAAAAFVCCGSISDLICSFTS